MYQVRVPQPKGIAGSRPGLVQIQETRCRRVESKQHAVDCRLVAGDRFLHCDRGRHEALPRVSRYTPGGPIASRPLLVIRL